MNSHLFLVSTPLNMLVASLVASKLPQSKHLILAPIDQPGGKVHKLFEIIESCSDSPFTEYIPVSFKKSGMKQKIAARKDATERFNKAMAEATSNTIWVTGCRSWYLDDDGIPASWPWSMERFKREMQTPDLNDMHMVS